MTDLDYGAFDALTFDCYETLIDWDVAAQRIAAPPFPGDRPGDPRTELVRYLAAHGDAMRAGTGHPLRYAARLDQRGEPVELDLDDAPHCLVVRATKSGKSLSAIGVSPRVVGIERGS